jgi:hypothetical protein
VPAGIHGLPDRSLATDCNAVMTSSATRIDGLGGQAADKGIEHGTNPPLGPPRGAADSILTPVD